MTSDAKLAVALVAAGGLAVALVAALRRSRRLEELAAAEARRRNELAVELMGTRNKFMHTDESVRLARAFKPRADDVYVVTYPKCGTTWMTQIVHALRTRGSTDFGEICEVIPWDILAQDCGQRLDAPQVARPRAFKSHEAWDDVAKGAKYIYVARDPLDAFVSFHQFLPAYINLEAGDIDAQTFADSIFAGAAQAGQIWSHFLGWWQATRSGAPVLWVFYEDLLADLEREVRRVGAFMGVECTAELVATASERSSFGFMSAKENAFHFDDHFVRGKILPKMGLPADTPIRVSKVRKGGGKAGTRKSLPQKVRDTLLQRWADVLAGPTGCADYAAFRRSLRDHESK
jgi:aryl sulfotransferase